MVTASVSVNGSEGARRRAAPDLSAARR